MSIWIYIAIGLGVLLIVLAVILLNSAVTIRLDMVMRKNEYKLHAEVKMVYGLIKRIYDLPFHLANGGIEFNQESVFKQGMTFGQDEDEQADQKPASRTIRFRQYSSAIMATKGFKKWVRQTLANVHLRDIRWSTEVALEHAADTAVASGLLHAIKHTVLGWLSYRLIMEEKPAVDVVPRFNGPPHFSTELNCIAKISFGKAMVAGLVFIVRVLKVKGGVRSWQNTLFKA